MIFALIQKYKLTSYYRQHVSPYFRHLRQLKETYVCFMAQVRYFLIFCTDIGHSNIIVKLSPKRYYKCI